MSASAPVETKLPNSKALGKRKAIDKQEEAAEEAPRNLRSETTQGGPRLTDAPGSVFTAERHPDCDAPSTFDTGSMIEEEVEFRYRRADGVMEKKAKSTAAKERETFQGSLPEQHLLGSDTPALGKKDVKANRLPDIAELLKLLPRDGPQMTESPNTNYVPDPPEVSASAAAEPEPKPPSSKALGKRKAIDEDEQAAEEAPRNHEREEMGQPQKVGKDVIYFTDALRRSYELAFDQCRTWQVRLTPLYQSTTPC